MIHSYLLALLVAYLLLCLGYALFSLKTTRSPLFRGVSLVYLGISVGLALYLYNQLLSQPRPLSQEFFNRAEEAVVLATYPHSGEAIYLWLQLPDDPQPAYYVMPWSGRTAEELEISQREAREHGGKVVMNGPFNQDHRHGLRTEEEDRIFSPAVPPRPPLKEAETGGIPSAQRHVPRTPALD